MPKATQLTFFGDSARVNYFGGKTKKRKTKRPIAVKRPMHVVLRAEKAKGALSLLAPKHSAMVKETVGRLSGRYRVRIFEWVNVGNHIHLLVQAQTREGFSNFLRRLAAEIALKVTQARKGKPFGKFWNDLVFTRVLFWGRAFEILKNYIVLNRYEAMGISKIRGRRIMATRGLRPPPIRVPQIALFDIVRI